MENTTKASIIITTYNRPQFLKRAIDSCLAQETTINYEIIVVDDNGKANVLQIETEQLVKSISEAIVYVPLETNSGACVARNKGVERAKGEFIFFLDDDDEFLPNKVEAQVIFLQKHQELDGCLAAFRRIDLYKSKEIISDSNFPVAGDFKNFVINGNFFTPMLCIKKESLKKIGGFKEIDRFQDRYLMLHALINGLTFKCINEPLYIMFEHNGDRITNKNKIKTIKSLNKIKGFIENYKNKFSDLEWNDYLTKDQRNRGIVYYVSKKYFIRVKGFKFFFKAFFLKKEMRDLKMMIKCIIKF